MIERLVGLFVSGVRFAERYSSLITTFVVLIAVPLAFLWTGQQFLEIGMDRAERLEKDRVGSMHDAIALLIQSEHDASSTQAFLEEYVHGNPDVRSILIQPLDGGAALTLGEPLQQEAYRDQSRAAALRLDESIIFEEYRENGRHWVALRAVGDQTNVMTHLLITDTSVAAVDTYFATKVRSAYGMLAIIVAVILLVLWRQVRVIDYARMYQELKAAHDTMSLFVNMTAHELRTPLTAIKWSASLLKEDSSKAQEHADRILSVSDNLLALITDLLDLARIQSGKMAFAHAEVDLSDIIMRTTTMLRPIASERKLTLLTEVQLAQRHIVMGDDARLSQAITNVISNALKYTREGTVTVALTRKRNHFEIRVKDTGMGISAEDQRRLFAPYFRVASPEVDRTTGTGLGMWITKRMLEEMGGTIDVESIKGVGTHIVITLPAA